MMRLKKISKESCPFAGDVQYWVHSNDQSSIYYVDTFISVGQGLFLETEGTNHFPISVGPIKGADQGVVIPLPEAGQFIAVPVKLDRKSVGWLKGQFLSVGKCRGCNHPNEYAGWVNFTQSSFPVDWKQERSFELIVPNQNLAL